MDLSVIICTRNRAVSLGQTLDSLVAVEVPEGLKVEIVVVDNGSTDDTAGVVQRRMVSAMPIRLVFEPTPGLSNARNTGLSRSGGDMILFSDDDLRFPKRWLESMCGPIVATVADGVAGNIDLAPHLQRRWMKPLHRDWLASSERLDPLYPSDMIGANMAFARRVLEVVPCFDPELGAGASGVGEESLFTLQMRKAGLKIRRSNGPAVVHWFDEKRLLRSNWLRAAKDRGASDAYLNYHWRHESASLVPLILFRKLSCYYFRRVFRWRECLSQEGAALWELFCLVGIHRLVGYSRESKRPRNYDREGLIKIRGVIASPKGPPVLKGSSIAPAI
jgi:glycosyltransferase involved in cell wall biosynthesis